MQTILEAKSRAKMVPDSSSECWGMLVESSTCTMDPCVALSDACRYKPLFTLPVKRNSLERF